MRWGRRCFWVPVGQRAPPWAPRGGHGAAEPWHLQWILPQPRLGTDRPQPPRVSGALREPRGNLCPCLDQRMVLSPTGAVPHQRCSWQIPFPIPVHTLFISFRSALSQQQPLRQRNPFLLSEGLVDLQKEQKVRAFHCPLPWMI